MTLVTYLGEPRLKSAFLHQISLHEQQDAFIKGTYGRMNGTFRGCAIGCALHSLNVLQGKVGKALTANIDEHDRYEAELGLPTWFAYLEDQIFEHLPYELATTWPRRLAEAIPVGAVVGDMVLAKILRWQLADPEFGVRYATDNEEVRGWIDIIVAAFDTEIATGGHATAEQREAAAWAAWAAWDACAARDASAAWAAYAARDACAAWAARAACAVWAARTAWAVWAARDAWAAGAAGDAGDARDAWAAGDAANSDVKKADAFFPSLSEFVLALVRALPVAEGKAS